MILSPDLDHRIEVLRFTTDNEISYGVVIEHNFSCDDESASVFFGEENL